MAYASSPRFHEIAGMAALDPAVAAYKKFIKDNLNQPNLLQFLQTDQGKRMDPNLAGAMLALEQLEKARDMTPQGPPPTTNVVQDVGMQAAQAAQQLQMQRGREQGIAQLPNPAMARAQFQGGIAQPTQMADGGIKQMAGGGPIAFQRGGESSVDTTRSTSYEFLDDLRAQVPSYMTDNMDIVSFTKAQLPNFDSLSPADKQTVLKQIEPAYNRARAAQSKLRERSAAPAGLPAVTGTPPQTVDMRGQMLRTAPDSGYSFENPLQPNQSAQDVFQAFSTPVRPPAEAAAKETRKVAPRPAAAKSPLDELAGMVGEKPDLEAMTKAREARQQKEKTGKYSQADADLAAFIKDQKDKGGDENTAYKNFWIMTGASLLGNRSPFFTQALGESIKENYGGLVKDLKQIKDDSKTLRLQEIQLRRSQEAAVESGAKEDQDRYERQLDNYQKKLFDVNKLKAEVHEKALDRSSNETIAKMRQTGNEKLADQLFKKWEVIQGMTDPAEKQKAMTQWQAELETANNVIENTTATGVGAMLRRETALSTSLARALQNDPTYKRASRDANDPSLDQKDREQAVKRMQDREQQIRATLGGGSRQLTPADNLYQSPNVSGGPYAGFSATPIG